MKAFISLLLLAFLNATTTVAQQSVFQEQNVLVIQLVNEQGIAIEKEGFVLKLDNPSKRMKVDSTICCEVHKNLILFPLKYVLLKTSNTVWNSYASDYKDLPLFDLKGCYGIVLGTDIIECLTGACSNKKDIILTYYHSNDNKLRFRAISKENLYSLFSRSSKWEEITPYQLVVKRYDQN